MSIRFYLSKNEQENVVIRALYDGCEDDKILTTLDNYEPSDVAVVMGVYKKAVPVSFPRGNVIAEQKRYGLDFLVLETGFIHRGSGEHHYYHLGWNGLNGRADFKNHNKPPDRAGKLGVELKPWQDGRHILLCGQVPWDASVDFTDHIRWLHDVTQQLRELTFRPIVFRPHPLGNVKEIPGALYSVGRPLSSDLDDCHAIVTFNSNTGVDAAIAGVPVFAFDCGSMAYRIANKKWFSIDEPDKPEIVREQWLFDIAYAQWTPAEMRSGEAWEHIGYRSGKDTAQKEV